MKKTRTIVSAVTLLAAVIFAFAFRSYEKIPGNLYYKNATNKCVVAPCETTNNTGTVCKLVTYTNSTCTTAYTGTPWATDGGK